MAYGPQFGAPAQEHPPLRSATAMPLVPTVYQQMLRGPRYRWWKPLLCLLLVVPMALLLIVVAVVPVIVAGLVTGAPDLVAYVTQATSETTNLGPVGFLYVNLSLIALIPAAGLSIWIVHGIRPRFLSSVRGGLRWRWLLRCLVIVVPLWALYIGISVAVEPSSSPRPAQWVALLVMVVLLTPLQAAAEEYLFRGWIMQNVGAWFAHPIAGLVVSLVVSAVAFSAAHLSPDPWVLGSIACLAIASGVAAWRTGGLEAGIAMHAVNNIFAFFVVLTFGGWEGAFVGQDTHGSPLMLGLAVGVHGAALALILWQAKRSGVQPRYVPSH